MSLSTEQSRWVEKWVQMRFFFLFSKKHTFQPQTPSPQRNESRDDFLPCSPSPSHPLGSPPSPLLCSVNTAFQRNVGLADLRCSSSGSAWPQCAPAAAAATALMMAAAEPSQLSSSFSPILLQGPSLSPSLFSPPVPHSALHKCSLPFLLSLLSFIISPDYIFDNSSFDDCITLVSLHKDRCLQSCIITTIPFSHSTLNPK